MAHMCYQYTKNIKEQSFTVKMHMDVQEWVTQMG